MYLRFVSVQIIVVKILVTCDGVFKRAIEYSGCTSQCTYVSFVLQILILFRQVNALSSNNHTKLNSTLWIKMQFVKGFFVYIYTNN